jgi:hypothetical protein
MLFTENIALKPGAMPQQVIDGRRLHYYDKGEIIPLDPQGVWQICRGVVQLSQIDAQGEDTILGWAISQAFFGLWLTQIDNYSANALSETYLKWYTVEELERSNTLASLMLKHVVSRLRQSEALLAITGLKRVEDRLVELLRFLKTELGEPSINGNTRLSIRLTHQNIANTIGTTRVTVTRLMGEFHRQGLVATDDKRHLIINEKR